MKINQVEELVGITKKNIRFYEEQGLLNPDRNPENGYREYSLDDVKCLLKIKLLRKIDVPIEEIRKLERGNVSFEECMQTQRDRLESEKSNVELMIGLCSKLESEVKDYDLIDAQVYLDELHKLEKGGAVFMDLTKNDVKNRSTAGAIVAALCSIALIVFPAVAALVAFVHDPIPNPVLIVLIVIPSIFIILIVTVLLQRIKEIRKGEAYEARKY
ncbi:MAG: MerR family transcriptional regulator [Lachnospiraceae bacterium]|nr:MerR family transcriptional regulator [Lachnospiraceae bacterium]